MARMPSQLGYRATPRVSAARMPPADVSSGLTQIGQALDAIAEAEQVKRERQRAEDDAVATATAITRYRARHTERLMAEGDALADENVDGFADRFAAVLDEDLQAEIEQLPERVRNRARVQFLDAREGLRLRAVDAEHGRRVARQGRLLDQQLAAAGAVVFHDATAYAQTLSDTQAAIEASGLPEAAQAQALDRVPGVLAGQRMLGLLENNPYNVVREINAGEWNGVLTAEDQSRYLNAAQAEIARREAEAERRRRQALERAQAALRIRMQDDLASIEATGRGVGVQLHEIERVFGAEAAEAYMRARRDAEENHALLSRWRFYSPDEIREDVARMGPRAGQEGFVAARERQERFARVAAAVLEQRAEDPAAAALAADPALAQLWSGLTDQHTDAHTRRVIVGQMRDRQERLGVPAGRQRLTTNAQAEAYAERIRGASATERARVLEEASSELSALYGADAPRALAEIARAAELPEFAALAMLGRDADRARLARALASPEQVLSSSQTRQMNSRLDRDLEPLRESLAALPGGAERYAQTREAAERAARASMAAGDNPSIAARDAAAMFTRDYQFRGALRIPRTWRGAPLSGDAVARGASRRLQQIRESGDFQLPSGRAADVREEDQARAARDALPLVARWVSDPADRGLILYDAQFGAPITDREGRQIIIPWEELEATGRASEMVPGFPYRVPQELRE